MTPGWSGDGWGSSGGSGLTPTAPTITHSRTVAANTSDWNVVDGGSSSSNNHNLFGTSGYGTSTITVYRDGVLQGTALTASDGSWTFPTGVLPDATMAFTATVTVGGITSVLSPAFDITITVSIIGFTNTPNTTFTVANMPSFAGTHAGQAWSTSMPDSHTIRFECRNGDRWTSGGDSVSTGRCEIGAGNGYVETYYMPFGTLQRMSAEIMWEAGAANDASGWFINFQCSNADGPAQANQGTSPFWTIGLSGASNTQSPGDRFYVQCRDWNSSYGQPIQSTVHVHDEYIAPANIVRGVWHRVQVEALPHAASGHLYAWFDGVQVANYTGPLGYGYPSFPGHGVYRGSSPTTTQSIQYRNLIIVVG